MIKIELTEWLNLDTLSAESMVREVGPELGPAMKAGLLVLESAIKTQLTGQRSGRTYRVTRRGRPAKQHQASAPGESPAVLYGNLRNSVGHRGPTWTSPWIIEGEAGPGLGQKPTGDTPDPGRAYARRLELGGVSTTPQGGTVRILPRPYMQKAADRAEPQIDKVFRRMLG